MPAGACSEVRGGTRHKHMRLLLNLEKKIKSELYLLSYVMNALIKLNVNNYLGKFPYYKNYNKGSSFKGSI